MTKAKFKIIVSTETNPNIEISFHFNDLANAVECARIYKKTPLVKSILIQNEFDTFWSYTPEQGEKEMGKFAQAIQESRGTFLGSTLKRLIAEHSIPFTVVAVSDLTWNKEYRVDEWHLSIKFDPSQIADYSELSQNMTLTFSKTVKGTAKRDENIVLLKEDCEEEGPVKNVLLTYDPNVGRNGWYDFSLAI